MAKMFSAAQEALGIIEQLAGVARTLSGNEEVRAACAASPLTKGRDFRDIVLDDVLETFEYLMINVPREEQPVDLYRSALQLRTHKPTTVEHANQQLWFKVSKYKALPTDTIPDAFKILTGHVDLDLLSSFEEQWEDVKHKIAMTVFNDGAYQVMQNTDKTGEALTRFIEEKLIQAEEENDMANDNDAPQGLLPIGAETITLEVGNGKTKKVPMLDYLLQRLCENTTDHAKNKPPVYGREPEMARLNDILLHHKKPFALLHGMEGAGQGAVVSALSRYLQSDDAPQRLKGATIQRVSLDSFTRISDHIKDCSPEEGLADLFRETELHNKSGKPPIILHVDDLGLDHYELHALRDVLSRELRTRSVPLICTVTDEEKFILERTDKDLMKHFQRVEVAPLSRENTLKELSHHARVLEAFHKVNISQEVQEHLVAKTDAKMPNMAQSGKSVKILDSAAAIAEADGASDMTDLHVDKAVAREMNLPLTVVRSELSDNIRDLEKNMKDDVFGQDEAIEAVCKKLRLVSNGLRKPNKPLATFNFNGGTGIGKSFIPKRLAFHLFGSEDNVIRLDLTGFGDKHTVSRIVGAPPGYAGYEDKGVLDDVIDKPFSVILIDEEDKADPNVRNALLPVFDEARLDKLDGKRLDFRNTIIIMTGNRGATAAQDAYSKPAIGFAEETPEQRRADAQKARATEIKQGLSPEFRNRFTDVHLNMLKRPHVEKIALREIESVSKILRDNKKFKDITITVVPNVVQELADIGFDPLMGARPMERAVEQSFTTPLNEWLLNDANKGLLGQTFELVVKGIKNGFEWEVKKPAPLALPAPVV